MISPPPFNLRRDAAAIAFVVLVGLTLQLLVYDRWLSLLDEGAIAQIADQINHGLPPYREAVHVAFPGVFYLTALLFRLFEPSLLVGRCFMVGLFAVFTVLVYLLARTIAGRGVALGVALLAVSYRIWAFPQWQMLNYSPLAIVCLLVGVAILALDVGRPRPFLPPLAGLVIGIGVTFRQDCAGMALAALSLFMLLSTRHASASWKTAFRRTAGFGIAGVLPPLAVMLAFLPAGLTGELLYQTVWVPLVAEPRWASQAAEGFYTGFPQFWPPWSRGEDIRSTGFFVYLPSLVLDLYWRDLLESPLFHDTLLPEIFVRTAYGLPYFLLLVFAGREAAALVRGRHAGGAAPPHVRCIWLLVFFGAALMAMFNRPRDWVHLMVLYAPTLVLLAGFTELLAGPAGGQRRRVVLGVGSFVVALALIASFSIAVAARGLYSKPLASPRGGLFVREHVAAVLEPLLRELTPASGDEPAPLAALPASPTLNFFTGRPLATRFLTLLPMEEFPDRNEQVVRDFARNPRTEFVYSLHQAAIDLRPQDYAPGVFTALTDEYELGEVFNGTQTEGLLLARLQRREHPDEAILYDFAGRLEDAAVSGGSAPEATLDVVSVDVWPFERPVLSVTPATPPGRRNLTYSVDVPVASRLRFGVAMNPDGWANFFVCSLRFSVEVDGDAVFDTPLDPRRDFADRCWVWADLPLSAGSHVITFATSADNRFCALPRTAGWARPRLVIPAPSDSLPEGAPRKPRAAELRPHPLRLP
jgi:hypothetical protein